MLVFKHDWLSNAQIASRAAQATNSHTVMKFGQAAAVADSCGSQHCVSARASARSEDRFDKDSASMPSCKGMDVNAANAQQKTRKCKMAAVKQQT